MQQVIIFYQRVSFATIFVLGNIQTTDLPCRSGNWKKCRIISSGKKALRWTSKA